MSERNIELARRSIAAFNAHDKEAVVSFFDPEVELFTRFAALGDVAIYHGHDGVRSWLRDLDETWEGIHQETEAFFDLGEQTLMFYTLRARGRQSGVEASMQFAAVSRSREGLITYFKAYAHREDALRDLGVSEDELEPIAP